MTPKKLAKSKIPSNEKICAILDGKLVDFYAKVCNDELLSPFLCYITRLASTSFAFDFSII